MSLLTVFLLFAAQLSLGDEALIKRTERPPNYETPNKYFNEVFTPNDLFFHRSHLANIPKVDVRAWRLTIEGEAITKPLTFSMEDLKTQFKPVEIAALAYCSGNRRGLVEPRVPGVQWTYGAMGNARWKGVRLKDVLAKAGLKKEAIEVVFDGADSPVIPKTPDFQKSIPLSKALDDDTLIAFEMNGKPLPADNGFPARIVVPGWTAPYWVKQLISIRVVSKPFDGYWMKTAYRIPKGKYPSVEVKWPSQESEANTPITEMVVNSLITNIDEGQHLKKGGQTLLKGMAWDGGHGMEKVEISIDGGKIWEKAKLGRDYGKYSWRQFTYLLHLGKPGEYTIMAKATNRLGVTQPIKAASSPGGYHMNSIQQLKVVIK